MGLCVVCSLDARQPAAVLSLFAHAGAESASTDLVITLRTKLKHDWGVLLGDRR
jgi:hypothetical protein